MTTTPICFLLQCMTFKIVILIHETNFPHSLFGQPRDIYISTEAPQKIVFTTHFAPPQTDLNLKTNYVNKFLAFFDYLLFPLS